MMTTQHTTDPAGNKVDRITIPPALDHETAKAQALDLSQTLEHEKEIEQNIIVIDKAND